MFIHKEKQSLKLAKWEAIALKGKLVRFDSHTIYRVYIEDQNKVIWVKNLQIFEDITSKVTTSLPDFDRKPRFNEVQIPDEKSNKSGTSKEKTNASKRPTKTWVKRTIKSSPKSKTKDRSKKNNELIIQLTSFLKDDCDESEKITVFLATSCKREVFNTKTKIEADPLNILASVIYKTNVADTSKFTSLTQLDIEEPKTYDWTMNGPHTQQ